MAKTKSPVIPPHLEDEVRSRHAEGISTRDLAEWLGREHRVRVSHMAVYRTVRRGEAVQTVRSAAEDHPTTDDPVECGSEGLDEPLDVLAELARDFRWAGTQAKACGRKGNHKAAKDYLAQRTKIGEQMARLKKVASIRAANGPRPSAVTEAATRVLEDLRRRRAEAEGDRAH